MITNKEQMYKAAPRNSAVVAVGSGEVLVTEMRVRDRLAFIAYAKEHPNDEDLVYAFLVSRCCAAVEGVDPAEIKERIGSLALNVLGTKIMELSGLLTEKKPPRRKKGSRTA